MAGDTALAAYLPNGAAVTFDLTTLAGSLAARWYDPREGRFRDEVRVQGGGPVELRPPDDQDWALLVQKAAQR
jgi:hypothetical protein